MIIKSHIRGGYRAAAEYLKQVGDNEKVRLVEMSDPDARNLDDAFGNMWAIGRTTRARKPLHHVSINPHKDERLTDTQVLRICTRLEEKYGYECGEHQRVIIEHVKDGRQHFHVMWNRVSLRTGRPAWPGHHWNKSKQAAREMEAELGLKRPSLRRKGPRVRGLHSFNHKQRRAGHGRKRARRIAGEYLRICKHPLRDLRLWVDETWATRGRPRRRCYLVPSRPSAGVGGNDLLRPLRSARTGRGIVARPSRPKAPVNVRLKFGSSIDDLIAWAWENRRSDILAQFGIFVSFDI